MEALVLLVCLVPIIFFVGVIGFVIGRATTRRGDPRRQFADLIRFWQQSRQIDRATAEHLLSLLRLQPVDTAVATPSPDVRSAPSPDVPAPASVPTALQDVVSQPGNAAPSVTPTQPSLAYEYTVVNPAAVTPLTLGTQTQPLHEEQAASSRLPATSSAASVTSEHQPDDAQAVPPLLAALLSMGARRTLLVIGTFLVMISSLVLVIFNWNRFPALVQVAFLSAFTGGVWGVGHWMQQKTTLTTAGRNLQSVAMLMMPVVVFSFTRPGLFNLEGSLALLVTSTLSFLVYTIGAWRSQRLFYSLAASAAAGAVLISSFWWWSVPASWQPVWSFVLSGIALVTTRLLDDQHRARLALGPRIIKIAVPPLALAISLGFFLVNPIPAEATTTIIVILLSATFALALAWLDRQPLWLWATAILIPMAAIVGVVHADDALMWINLSFAGLTLLYPLLAVIAERRDPAYSRPFLALILFLAIVAAVSATNWIAIRRSYPILIAATFLVIGLLEVRRLTLLQPWRNEVGGISLAAQLGLLSIWPGAFVETWELRALIVLVVGAVAFIVSAIPLRGFLSYAPPLWCYGGAFLVAVGAGWSSWLSSDLRLPTLTVATVLYGWRAIINREHVWAFMTITTGLVLSSVILDRVGWLANTDHYLLASVLFAGGLSIGGSVLNKYAVRYNYWAPSALVWAGVLGSIGSVLFLSVFLSPTYAAVYAALIGSATIAVLSVMYRNWRFGYPIALLLAGAWAMAIASNLITWDGSWHVLSVLLLALAVGYGLITLILRGWSPFDRPYAQSALGVALLAPLPAIFELNAFIFLLLPAALLPNLALTAAGSAAIIAIGAFVYRRWRLTSLVQIQLLIALGSTVHWLSAENSTVTGWSLLVTASMITLSSAAVRRRFAGASINYITGDSYVISSVVMLLALALLFNGVIGKLSLPLLLVAITIGIVAWLEQSRLVAGLNLIALVGSLSTALSLTPLTIAWQAAWFVLLLVPLLLVGWLAPRLRSTAIWQQPSLWIPLAAAGFIGLLALTDLRASVVALVNGGVLLVTATLRERNSLYAYLAGALFVTASLGQFLVWELRELQLYVVPVGVYLFGLAAGIRRFQRQIQVARLVDSAAVCLLLGATFIQAAGSVSNIGYIMLFVLESLLVATYGTLARLRAPFIGGVAGFVIGVLWMAANAARMLNQWLLLGALGILMLLAYVILERQQDQLRRFGRDLIVRLKQWQ